MSNLGLVIKGAAFKAGDRFLRNRAALARRRLRVHLGFVWDHSPFYRLFWADHGIGRAMLADIELEDLPKTNRQLLMENLDDVFTDRRLNRLDLERWMQEDPGPDSRLFERYHVMQTSGGLSASGIFVFDDRALETLGAEMMVKVGYTKRQFTRRTRAVYLGSSQGRVAGPVLSRNILPSLYDVQICAVMDEPFEKIVKELNSFQPDQITGGSVALARLASYAEMGELRINPEFIVATGDMMTEAARQDVISTWGVEPVDLYGTTECLLGVRRSGDDSFRIFDNIALVEAEEALEDDHARVVMTNLYNRTTPIIRYETRDRVIAGERFMGNCVSAIQSFV